MGLINWLKKIFKEKEMTPDEARMAQGLPAQAPNYIEKGKVCAYEGCNQPVSEGSVCRFCGKGVCEMHSGISVPQLPEERTQEMKIPELPPLKAPEAP
jgi:hypothetical protein